MNQHYCNALSMLDLHTKYTEESNKYVSEKDAILFETCMELGRQCLMRAQVEATLATLTQEQIIG